MLRSAQIHGDVQYEALTIEQGAQVDGRFAHGTKANDAVAASQKPAHQPTGDQPKAEDGEPKLGLVN